MIQIIAALVLALVIFIVIKDNKEKITPEKMIYTAILLSLSLVIHMFSINVPFFGGQVVVRFSQIILVIIGAAFGPIYGLMGSLGFDIISLLINPLGSFYIGFTLGNVLVSLIPAFLFKYFRNKGNLFNLSLLSISGSMYVLYIVGVIILSFVNVSVRDLMNVSMITGFLVFFAIFILFIVGILVYVRKKKIKLDNNLLLLVTSLILIELIVQGFLTPLWLSDMMKTPIILSMQIRAIKGIPMIVINTLVGYPLLRLVNKRA